MADARLGVDVGGTFTDFVVFDPGSGSFSIGKTLTTPHDLALGIVRGAREAAERAGFQVGDISQVTYGTTLVANLLLERKGVRVGLIATEGFRDVLETGTEQRYDMYDLTARRADPLVPRRLRRTVRERVTWDGRVLVPLDLSSLNRIVSHFEEHGVETIAVALMHSYRNPAHERMVRDYLQTRYPQYGVSLSSEVAPEVREYPRTSTTVANAYVEPPLRGHLEEMEEGLRALGFAGVIYMMLSEGGITTLEAARSFPVRLVESGPAAGAMAAAYYGKALGYDNLVSFDMGGTTAKLCLITGGRPSRTSEFEVARQHRFKKGSGLILKVPAIDMIEIGAGGGSIAYVDPLGLMKVGPQSAGADPGPACYGLGGTEPTVSDADLVLGLLDPGYFLGGEISLDASAARKAIETRLAGPYEHECHACGPGHTRRRQREHGDSRPHARVGAGAGRPGQRPGGLWRRGSGPRLPCGQAAGNRQGRLPPRRGRHVVDWNARRAQILRLGPELHQPPGQRRLGPRRLDLRDNGVRRDRSPCGCRGRCGRHRDGTQRRHAVRGPGLRDRRPRAQRQAGTGPARDPGVGLQRRLRVPVRTHPAQRGRRDDHLEAVGIRTSAQSQHSIPVQRIEGLSQRAEGQASGVHHRGRQVSRLPSLRPLRPQPGSTLDGPAIVEERESTAFVGPNAACAIDEHLNLMMSLE